MPTYEVEIHTGHGFHPIQGPNGSTHFTSLEEARIAARSASRLGDPTRVVKITRLVMSGYDRGMPILPSPAALRKEE